MSNKYPGGIITSGANAGYSVAFDGNGDFLTVPNNSAFLFGTGDFTVEFWVNFSSISATYQCIAAVWQGSTNYAWNISINNANVSFAYGNGGSSGSSVTFACTPTTNTWAHFAVTRASNSVRCFLNGAQIGTTQTISNNLTSGTSLYIGANQDAGPTQYVNGYVSNLRIIKGTALYTAAFTPPTQLLNVTNTSLLTCNSPAIVDQSSNAFAITANGNAAVSTFTPFQGYVAYNPALGAATPGIWTVSDAIQAAQTRRWNMYDPYFNLTTLLLHGNGTNGAQNNTFLDSSSNNFTITRNGNTTQGTFSPFSQTGWGNYFGGDGNYITAPYNAAFDYGTGDFSVECFAYIIDAGRSADSSKYGTLISGGLTSSNTNLWNLYFLITSGVISSIGFDNGGAIILTASSQSISLNAWHHFVLCRTGTTLSMFVDGNRIATTTYSSAVNTNSSGNVQISRSAYGSIYQNWASGYFSNVRIVKGTQPYNAASSTITQPTAPLTAITNTSLLTCQSNRFIDNSTNAFAITVNGSPSVQPFSPFYPVVAYTPQTQGGSGYFDGAGDYLLGPSGNVNIQLSGSFTVEAWVYPTVAGGAIFTLNGTSTSGWPGAAGGLAIQLSEVNIGTATTISFTALKVNTWSHIAVVRNGMSGTNITVYINGVSVATGSYTSSIGNGTDRFGIGFFDNFSGSIRGPFTGYISGLRVVNGSAVYTAAFTPPTAPLTAITNTSLLTNFTNAGIIDSTGDNVLETVSGAQISTAQSKFGGSSLLFNGSSDYLVSTAANTRNLVNFGTGDFTVECWVYFNGTGTNQGFLDSATSTSSGTSGQWFFNRTSAGNLQYGQHGVGAIISAAWSVSTGVWYHIAICRSSGQSRLFANGVQLGSTTSDTVNYNNAGSLQVGVNATPYWMNGYIDEIRISRYARYTANFTPQTSQWQDQ